MRTSPLIERLRVWRHSALAFVKECIGAEPTSQQVEGLLAVSKAKKITIRSGHGCGKDALAAWTALWFMATRPYAKVVCTAPTARQLQDILWAELAKWQRKSPALQEEFVHQRDKLFCKYAPKEWWIRAISIQVKASKEEQAETLAGLHGDHLLVIADEASGIPDPVFIPLEGALTQEDNRVLLIGNMTKNSGYFYDTHFHANIRKEWTRIHWDSRESSLVTDEWVSYMKDKYGEDSSVFAVRVKGEPPHEDEKTLIPLAWARQCLGNEIEVAEEEPLYLGVDVARYGEDKSVILPRKGLKIYPWESFQGLNTIDLGGRIEIAYLEQRAEGLAIDEIGVGAGVTDWLRKERRLRVYGVNVANKSSDIRKYDRLRDELWWRVREKCMKGLYSFPEGEKGEELCDELASPYYEFNKHGGVIVESKKKMKARGVGSPNIADALCLTEYFSDVAHRIFKERKRRELAGRRRSRIIVPRQYGWMVA